MYLLNLLCTFAGFVVSAATLSKLSFHDDGTFKILQVADAHYGNGKWDSCFDVDYSTLAFCDGTHTTQFLARVLAQEKPDLVVFTGDQIDGHASDPAAALDALLDPVIQTKTKWTAILGNHDGENIFTRERVIQYLANKPYAMMPNDTGTFVLSIIDKNHTTRTPLWFFDSGNRYNAHSYDWIRTKQLNWMENMASALRLVAASHNVTVNPALAFWHIPIREFGNLASIKGGDKNEGVSASHVNSGLYGTLLLNGVKAGFVGHDHTNDYCGTGFEGVVLCYGGGMGYHTYGRKGWPRRMRVIQLLENGRKAATWVHRDIKMSEAVTGFIPLFSDDPKFTFNSNVKLTAVSLAPRSFQQKTALFVFLLTLARSL